MVVVFLRMNVENACYRDYLSTRSIQVEVKHRLLSFSAIRQKTRLDAKPENTEINMEDRFDYRSRSKDRILLFAQFSASANLKYFRSSPIFLDARRALRLHSSFPRYETKSHFRSNYEFRLYR